MSRLRQFVLLVVLSLLLVIACQRQFLRFPRVDEPIAARSIATDCRSIQHLMGEACVPFQPQRIVALDPIYVLDPLLALGVEPVGTVVDDWQDNRTWGGLPPSQVASIEPVGQTYQPSLEKLLLLKPDLMLGLTDLRQYYQNLSTIAPTVLLGFVEEVRLSFKQHLRAIAQIVGREAEAEAVLAQYQARIDALRTELQGRLDDKEISVIYFSDGNFWSPDRYSVFFQVLRDIGMTIKPIFDKDNAIIRNPTFSIEAIDQYDADVLFICDDDGKSADFFHNNPLIAALESAKNQRLYVVSGHTWRAYGPSVIARIVDDLSQYLPQAAATIAEKQGNNDKLIEQ